MVKITLDNPKGENEMKKQIIEKKSKMQIPREGKRKEKQMSTTKEKKLEEKMKTESTEAKSNLKSESKTEEKEMNLKTEEKVELVTKGEKTMLTKAEVLNFLGNNYKKNGAELEFQCPVCADEGGDNSKNNLKFNEKKGVLYCFAGGESHTKELYKQILATRHKATKIKKSTKGLEITAELVANANEMLLNSHEWLQKLEQATGIKAETVKECNIGYLKDYDAFMFPCYDAYGNLFGAEFRNSDFSKLPSGAKMWKANGTVSKLCKINNPKNPKKLLVIEGFKDGYNIFQYINENDIVEEYQIVTPSNGVNSVPKLLKENDISRYEQVILALDNDTAGKQAAKKVALTINRPIYELRLPPHETYLKDFSDWYNICNDNSRLFDECIVPQLYSVVAGIIREPSKYSLGAPNKIILEQGILFKTQIIEYRGRYVQVCSTVEKDVPYLVFTVLSNYVIEPIRNVLEADTFNWEKNKYLFEIRLVDDSGFKSSKIVLTPEDKANLRSFRSKVYEKGNFTDVFNDKQFAQIFDSLYKENTLDKIYRHSLPGRIANDIFLYQDAAVEIHTGKVYTKSGDTIKLNDGKSIILDSEISNSPILKHSEEYTCKQIAEKLIESMLKGYCNSAQPFLVFGVASMSVFRDLFKEITGGFPIPYLYGPTQGGKTNLLNTICYMYGFDKTYISSGSSTVNATWKNLSKRSRIPVILDEVLTYTRYADPFENLIKCGYDCKKRERMFNGQKEDNQPVNATLILSSNHTPPQKEEVLNRLVYGEFDPRLFNVAEVIDFNGIRDKYLSNLLIAFLSLSEDTLNQYFNDSKSEIGEKYAQLRERDKNNMAIAFTGIKALFNIAEMVIPTELQENIDKYFAGYEKIYDVKTALDKFISYLPLLRSEMKIKGFEDYKVENGVLYLHYALAYKYFARYYRQTEGEQPPKSKDILNVAKYHSGIDKGPDQVAKPETVGGKKKRCLVIDMSQFEDLADFSEATNDPIETKVELPKNLALVS